MCSSISLGRSISSMEKSLSRAGIFAQDWLFFGSRSSGIHQNVSSIRAIITLEFNLQHTQDKLALMTKEGDSGDLRLVLRGLRRSQYDNKLGQWVLVEESYLLGYGISNGGVMEENSRKMCWVEIHRRLWDWEFHENDKALSEVHGRHYNHGPRVISIWIMRI